MLNVENRTPHPGKEGRVRLRQDNGQVIEGVLEMADDATSPGTPWNRQSGRLLQADIRTYPVAEGYEVKAGDVVDVIENQIISRRTTLSNIEVGNSVMINEDGTPVEYIVVHKGVPSKIYDTSCNGAWLLRKDIVDKQPFQPERNNIYETSNVYNWLNSTMSKKYDSTLGIKQVKIPYLSGGGVNGSLKTGANGLLCDIFLLSGYELGWTKEDDSLIPADGAVLDYFKDSQSVATKRISSFNGVNHPWCTRSPELLDQENVYEVTSSGGLSSITFADVDVGIRPAIILSFNNIVFSNSITTQQAIALQSGTAGQSIEVIYSGTVAADWVTEGKVIESNGVYGVGVLGKVLQVWSKDRPWVVYGSFTATAKKSIHVNLGFEPSVVIMYAGANNDSGGVAFDSYNYNGYSAAYYFARVYTKAYFSLSNDNKITHDGFNFYASKADGGTDSRTVYYVAWR